jgi:hypothetical protein
VEAFKRFPVTAKYKFIDDRKIILIKYAHDAIDARFPTLKPK